MTLLAQEHETPLGGVPQSHCGRHPGNTDFVLTAGCSFMVRLHCAAYFRRRRKYPLRSDMNVCSVEYRPAYETILDTTFSEWSAGERGLMLLSAPFARALIPVSMFVSEEVAPE